MGYDAKISYITYLHDGNIIHCSAKLTLMPESLSESINFAPEAKSNKPLVWPVAFRWIISSGWRIIVLTQVILLITFGIRLKINGDVSELSSQFETKQTALSELMETESEY